MDTSKEYIKQCEKAVEIQALYSSNIEWLAGDYYSYLDKTHHYEGKYPGGVWAEGWTCNISYNDSEYGLDARGNKHTWLPRQDQLQEMVKDKRLSWSAYLHDFFNFSIPYPKDWSMEQLWLAFVMKEKYDKTWNGEDWIKTTQ